MLLLISCVQKQNYLSLQNKNRPKPKPEKSSLHNELAYIYIHVLYMQVIGQFAVVPSTI